jgi:hypothetical protein
VNHELKTWPEFFDAVDSGKKTFEVRHDDRGFQVGDTLTLMRWRPNPGRLYSGDYVDREDREVGWDKCAKLKLCITYKLPGGRFGIDAAWCVLGFVKEPQP